MGFLGDEVMDLEELIHSSAHKRPKYSEEYNIQAGLEALSLQQAYLSTVNMDMPFTPVYDSNQTFSFESQELYTSLSTEGPVSDHSEDSSQVQAED